MTGCAALLAAARGHRCHRLLGLAYRFYG
ncbi:hypothetical protein F01_500052 [Burkholderia cenocepacia]|nr:hypothetical protein F01_500052 [Burkholderia cenocepacia]